MNKNIWGIICLPVLNFSNNQETIGIHFEKSTNIAITVSTRIESTTAAAGSGSAHTAASATSNLVSTASTLNHTVCWEQIIIQMFNPSKTPLQNKCVPRWWNSTYALIPQNTVQDFLIKFGIKPRIHLWKIRILSLDNLIDQTYQNFNKAEKNWAHLL